MPDKFPYREWSATGDQTKMKNKIVNIMKFYKVGRGLA